MNKVIADAEQMFLNLAEVLENSDAVRLAFVGGMRRDVRNAFTFGVDPVTGAGWKPGKKSNGRLLVRTGLMMESALRAIDDAERGGGFSGSVGITVSLKSPSYAFVHQSGGGKVPQRRFFGVSPGTVLNTRLALVAEINKVLGS